MQVDIASVIAVLVWSANYWQYSREGHTTATITLKPSNIPLKVQNTQQVEMKTDTIQLTDGEGTRKRSALETETTAQYLSLNNKDDASHVGCDSVGRVQYS